LAGIPGKYIIGLTGNIGTGKTSVRRMLEHLGAYTIDADGLSHRAIAKGAPGYEPVVEVFGKWILDVDGEVDRSKLGRLVFQDPAALQKLEAIVHPLVRQAVGLLVRQTPQSVVVIEAIKLLEGELKGLCDAVWVTYSPKAAQIERLKARRHMSHDEALRRIGLQGAQTDKIAAANVVIRNTGSFDDLWKQVQDAWAVHVPTPPAAGTPGAPPEGSAVFTVSRGRPKDAEAIAELENRLGHPTKALQADDIVAEFGNKAYMLLYRNKTLVGLAGWQVENLVVRVSDLYLDGDVDTGQALRSLLKEIESVSMDLQCEASLVFPDRQLATGARLWDSLGYEKRLPHDLGVQAWTEAAKESMPDGADLFFKQLRKDRILRPI
jgi:dephospho-CoA kinase